MEIQIQILSGCTSLLNPNSIEEGGLFTPCDAKFRRKKCPCSHNDNTAFITQISLFNTVLVMTNT